jgi:hypothetical protein
VAAVSVVVGVLVVGLLVVGLLCEAARTRDPSTLDTLTPQELQIAKLVGG